MRTLLGLLLLVIGVVLVAAGIWGLTGMADDGISQDITEAGMNALSAADEKLAELTGDTTVTGLISEWTDGSVDLTSTERILQTINDNALVILLCGIIGVLAGFILIRRS